QQHDRRAQVLLQATRDGHGHDIRPCPAMPACGAAKVLPGNREVGGGPGGGITIPYPWLHVGKSPRSRRPLLARRLCRQSRDAQPIPGKARAYTAGASRFPVDIFEYAFDRVPAMGVEMARPTPLLRWRHDEGPVPDAGMLPVLPALRELLPGGLRRGTVVAVGGWGLLCLAVAAGASAAGAWCAAVGLPHLGVAAAAEAGLDPGRLLLVPG